jgi:hypothetical protein
MMAAFDQYNPDMAAPFFEELKTHLSSPLLSPIRDQMERFDMGQCKAETRRLARDLGVEL